MSFLRRITAALSFAAVLAGCSGMPNATSTLPQTGSPTTSSQGIRSVASLAPPQMLPQVDFAAGLARGLFVHVCSSGGVGIARCHAILRTDSGAGRSEQGSRAAATLPAGYGPAQLQGAYGLTGAASTSGKIVAIIDAYNDPNLESDLGVYRSTYGLPACTTSNGCFSKVNQSGVQGSYPRNNGSWAQETSLDVDMVSANCPACHILVVETNSASFTNLSAGVNTAARLGAVAISNSYGGSESSSDATYAPSYNHPGVTITASSGDSGYGPQTPASYGTVVAAGGTTLNLSGNSRASETVWSGAGSGCSAYESQPSWQAAVLPAPGCANRVIADVAYDADPNTGVAVYDSYRYAGQAGWLVFGGTSVASPALAALYARASNTGGASYPAAYTYAHKSSLYDVSSGSNGTCSPAYLCTGEGGYDGPTGLGTPIGLGSL